MIGLLGDNGRVESGRISFEQVDLLRISSRELRNIRGAQLGMVFQNPGMSFNPILQDWCSVFGSAKKSWKD